MTNTYFHRSSNAYKMILKKGVKRECETGFLRFASDEPVFLWFASDEPVFYGLHPMNRFFTVCIR